MAFISRFPADILYRTFELTAQDTATLFSASLVCSSWRGHVLPVLLRHVHLSSHDQVHLPGSARSSLYPDELNLADEEPQNPRERQIAFLRLILGRPDLALMVQSLAWTLVWRDENDSESEHTDLELRIWEAFGLMRNVRKLDLAGIHGNGDLRYARQNPELLFPAVQDLRLGGVLHRRLVKAIIKSLDASKLVALRLDHLQDEGAWHTGVPLPWHIVKKEIRALPRGNPYSDQGVSDEVFQQQERGAAAWAPGPMWYPLRLLRQLPLTSLTRFTVELCPPSDGVFERNDITMFQEIANFVQV